MSGTERTAGMSEKCELCGGKKPEAEAAWNAPRQGRSEATYPCSAVQCLAGYLREHGYDGLYSDECGCTVDDLAPCGNMSMSYCFAGYNDTREARRQGCDFWITPNQSNDQVEFQEGSEAE